MPLFGNELFLVLVFALNHRDEDKGVGANKERTRMALPSVLAILFICSSVLPPTEGLLNKNNFGAFSFGRCNKDLLARTAKKPLDRNRVSAPNKDKLHYK